MNKKGLADSPFFTTSPEPSGQEQPIFNGSERNIERTEIRSEYRTLDLPAKRRTTRYSFEFYEDQLVKLKQLKFEAEQAGKKVFLSDLAREALDQYLRDKGL